MRLYVDCDDTLVLWYDEPHKGRALYHGDEYVPNNDLLDAITSFLGPRPDCSLVVWSGGGIDYAGMWARRFFGDEPTWIAMAKDVTLPEAGDVVVDDQFLKLRKGVILHTWQSFVRSTIPV